jgi:two-component system cell cycle response regulator
LAQLLLIDDSATHRQLIRRAVESARSFDRVLEATDGLSGLKRLMDEDVDVVVCDLEMPAFDGEKLLHVVKASPASRDIPFIFITGSADADRKVRLLEVGASDVIDKPFYPPELVVRIEMQLRNRRLHAELVDKNKMLARLSTTDAVTKLRTRRYASDALAIEFLRARRYGSPLSVLMADLDHFKGVNDEYGHVAGDTVLQGVSDILLGAIRATDIAGRYGGEEILVILAHNDLLGAITLGERWRSLVEAARFEAPDGRQMSVRLSIGAATFDDSLQAAEGLVDLADTALYKAKAGGRNCVVPSVVSR